MVAHRSFDEEVRVRIFDELADAILVADDDRRYVDVNDAACALFGRSRAELLSLRVEDVMGYEPGADVAKMWLDFLAEGAQSGRFPIERNGETLVVEYRARARVARGRHVSILRDVTEHARAMEAAVRRDVQFRRLADHLPFVVARFDRRRRHVYVNEAAGRLSGRAPGAFIGRTNEELGMPPESVREWNALLDRAFAGEEVNAEFFYADGAGGAGVRRLFESRLVPERASDGEVETVLAVVTEITEQREALSRQRGLTRVAEEARGVLDALLRAAPIGFCFLDRELRFQMINPELAAMNGVPVEAHIGKTPMEVLPGIAADFVRTHAERVFETGEPELDLELEGETPQQPGVKRTWVEHWYPVRVDGEIIGVGIVVEEVTERRHAEARVREAAELRERLMAIVSHDLRNPLGGITNAAHIIGLDPGASHNVKSLADRVLKMGRRMSSLIEQLLDFARIDQAGGLVLEPTRMELSRVVARAVDECGLTFPAADIAVRAEGSTLGTWDEDRIFQVVSNLVSNAVQHGDGHVDVHIDGKDAAVVRLHIENHGKAIPAEMLPVLFDPFRRASGGFARRSGLGLGLFISRSIVEAHKGTITVTSDGERTCFTVTLPRV